MKKFLLLAGMVLGLAGLAGWGCHAPGPGPIAPQRPFTLVQMCDPQLGFDNYAADLGRLRSAVEQINALRPDLVVICGDLVNGASEKTFGDFTAAKAGLKVPAYCAPGNHDLGNTPTPKSLARYRKCIGRDYYAVEHKGCLFVVVNAQLWKAPVAGESEQQDAWLKRTLEGAARRHRPVFIVSHYLLYEKDPAEPEAYFNLPVEKRKELLALFERCGVVAVLAGHTHTTIVRDYHGIQMVASETTSRNFDHHPFGFRLWHIGPTRPYRHEFVPLRDQTGSQPANH